MTGSIVSKMNISAKTSSATQQKMDASTMAIVGSMGFISASIGGGALTCFVSALVNAGPLELVKGFLSALTGI